MISHNAEFYEALCPVPCHSTPLTITITITNHITLHCCIVLLTSGGLFMISHNAEFYEALCPEKWILESGRLTVMGAEWMEEVEKARKKAEKLAKRSLNLEEQEVNYDALGNTIAVVEVILQSDVSMQQALSIHRALSIHYSIVRPYTLQPSFLTLYPSLMFCSPLFALPLPGEEGVIPW